MQSKRQIKTDIRSVFQSLIIKLTTYSDSINFVVIGKQTCWFHRDKIYTKLIEVGLIKSMCFISSDLHRFFMIRLANFGF